MFGMNLFDECVELIKQWKPQQKYSTEEDYKKDLRDFLFKSLNRESPFYGKRSINVKEEVGRSLCDIAIGREVGIEIKFGKNGKIKQGEIDRLKGQVERHRIDYQGGIIVVLVGDVDDYSFEDIRENLNRLYYLINRDFGFGLNIFNLRLINKSHSKKESIKSQDTYGLGNSIKDLF